MFRTKSDWLPVVSLSLAMVLWAVSFIAVKLAVNVYDPFFVVFGRMIVAVLCFLLLIGKLRGNTYRVGDLKYILFMLLCEPCLYFIFEAKAIQNTTASQAGMITAILPLMVAIAARIFLRETISRRTLSGFVLAVLGVCWLSLGSEPSQSSPDPALGNLLQFIAMGCATGYIIALKRLSERYRPLFLTALQALAGSLFFLPFLLLRPSSLPTHFDATPLLSILFLGVFVTFGAYGLYNYGVSRIAANQAAAFVNLIPVFTVMLGWAILGEQLTGSQYIACALVFLGVFLSQEKIERAPILLPELAHAQARASYAQHTAASTRQN
ncbi:MAG: DMT family transporter [Desulforhabdus sp.]|nr:DMT family transporter [Desulforhabdus sp.]